MAQKMKFSSIQNSDGLRGHPVEARFWTVDNAVTWKLEIDGIDFG